MNKYLKIARTLAQISNCQLLQATMAFYMVMGKEMAKIVWSGAKSLLRSGAKLVLDLVNDDDPAAANKKVRDI